MLGIPGILLCDYISINSIIELLFLHYQILTYFIQFQETHSQMRNAVSSTCGRMQWEALQYMCLTYQQEK